MHCHGFKNYQLGKWSDQKFLRHVKDCPMCQEAEKRDQELFDLARSLKTHVSAPYLWTRIESSVHSDTSYKELPLFRMVWRIHPLIRMAAVLILGIGLGFILKSGLLPAQAGILADSALKRVQVHERAYESAIAELEMESQQQLAAMDLELMLLYRDRLETIDGQINECKNVLAGNPANAHIRRYLLAALKEKKATLNEIIQWTPYADPV